MATDAHGIPVSDGDRVRCLNDSRACIVVEVVSGQLAQLAPEAPYGAPVFLQSLSLTERIEHG